MLVLYLWWKNGIYVGKFIEYLRWYFLEGIEWKFWWLDEEYSCYYLMGIE